MAIETITTWGYTIGERQAHSWGVFAVNGLRLMVHLKQVDGDPNTRDGWAFAWLDGRGWVKVLKRYIPECWAGANDDAEWLQIVEDMAPIVIRIVDGGRLT